jgi:signal transduction histidine kinase
VEDRVDGPALGDLGVELRVLAPDATAEGEVEASRTVAEAGVALPFQAVLVRVRPPAPSFGGPSDLFYWAIIAGATGGLALGGYVLVRTIRREVRLARLKADFVSNLSHELKTPLTSIAMFTEMLRDGKMTTAEDREEAYDVLTQEAGRLQRIVTSMIDVARREARAVPYELKLGDLNAPVHEAAARMRRLVTEPGLDLRVETAGAPLPVRMDAAAVDDAVTNLLSNAWKYRNGDRAKIVVRTTRAGRRAEVVVSDDGVGIPRRERRRVFEMFYRADAFLNRSVQGTGLGLALVRTIVRAHKGTVRIETGENGVGTTFRVRIPLAKGPLPAPAPAPVRTEPQHEPTEARAAT